MVIFHKEITMDDLWKNRDALLYSAWPNIGNIVNSILEKVIPIIPTMNGPHVYCSNHGCDYFVTTLKLGIINLCRFLLVMGVIIVVLSIVCAVLIHVRGNKRKTNKDEQDLPSDFDGRRYPQEFEPYSPLTPRVKIAIRCAVIGLVIALLAILLGNSVPNTIQPAP